MAISRSFLAATSLALFFSLLLHLHLTQADEHHSWMMSISEAPSPSPSSPQKIDCIAACNGRCRLSKRPNLCRRSCRSCCGRCNCVPPGTYGNYEACPCYASLTTPYHTKKCP